MLVSVLALCSAVCRHHEERAAIGRVNTHPTGAALVDQQAEVAARSVLHGDCEVMRRQEHLLRRDKRLLQVL